MSRKCERIGQPTGQRLPRRFVGSVGLGRDSQEKKLIEKIIENLIEMEFGLSDMSQLIGNSNDFWS